MKLAGKDLVGALACLCALPLLLTGCISTRVTSQRSPEFEGGAETVLVVAATDDLRFRKFIEAALVRRLEGLDASGISSFDILFGHDLSPDRLQQAAVAAGADVVLLIQPGTRGSTEHYVPPTYTTSHTGTLATQSSARGTVYDYGGTSTWSATGNTSGRYNGTSVTTTSGGYNIRKPWANYSASLVRVSDMQAVWIASAESRGGGGVSQGDLALSVSAEVANALASDGVITGARPVLASIDEL